MTTKENLLTEVQKSRQNLEQEKSLNEIDGNSSCNTLYLADHLYKNTEFQPYIRWGAVDYYNKNYPDRMTAQHDNRIHFWVEVQIDGKWVIADIYSARSKEDSIENGETVVAEEINSYVTFPNTLYEYTPKIQPKHLIGPRMSKLKVIVRPEE